MIKLRVDDETAIPLSVDSSSAVSMTVSEAFIDRGGSAIQNNKNATPSTSQVVVTPDEGFDGMAKVTIAAMPQGEVQPASLSYDTYLLRGRITAQADVTQSGYIPAGAATVAMEYCDELLPSENPKTVTPTTSEQTAVAANKWTKGAIKVGPIPSEYIVPSGTKSITANGTGIDVKSYEKVNVNVPGIVPSGTLAIATNGSHDVTNYATANVAVPASAVDSGTKSITANGNNQDVVGYAAVNVNVPNSYAAADEGKVVQSGALVSQSSQNITENGTYDTTTKNEVVVDVQSGGGITKVEGDFTIASESAYNCPTITHNLGTQKIGVLIYPKTSLAPADIYRVLHHEFINTNALCDGQTWTFDFSRYSTGLTTPVSIPIPSDKLDVGYTMIAPAKTSTDWANGNPNYCHQRSGSYVLTDNTFKYNGSGYSNRFPVGTFHYIIWKLE